MKVKTIGTLIAGALLDGYGVLGGAPFDRANKQRGPETPDLAADAAATVFDYHRSAKAKWINAKRPVTFPTLDQPLPTGYNKDQADGPQ